jgi:hypothetical protein
MNARKASALATVSRGAMMQAITPGRIKITDKNRAPRTYEEQAAMKFAALLERTGATLD